MINKTTVESIMTKGVFTVELDDPIRKADELMRDQQVSHIPVVEKKKFIGLITETTLMKYTLRQIYDFDDNIEEAGQNRISDFRDVMEKNVHIIYPEDSVHKAVQLMVKKKTHCLPVVDWAQNLVGILTFLDILLFFNKMLSDDKK